MTIPEQVLITVPHHLHGLLEFGILVAVGVTFG